MQKEAILAMENEIRGYQMSHVKEQKRSEELSERESQLNNDIVRLKQQIQKLLSEVYHELIKRKILIKKK